MPLNVWYHNHPNVLNKMSAYVTRALVDLEVSTQLTIETVYV